MPSLTELAKEFGVTPSTLRNWTGEFSDHLSPLANPGKGKNRTYSQEDAEIITLVAEMRGQAAKYADIHAALEAGDIGQWPPFRPEDDAKQGKEDGQNTALVTKLTATVANFEGQLTRLEEERDHLRGQLDGERESRLDAETRAAAAEAKLEVLEGRRPWWRFWGE